MEDLSQSNFGARIAEDSPAARSYPPSYMDRLMEAGQRLPGRVARGTRSRGLPVDYRGLERPGRPAHRRTAGRS